METSNAIVDLARESNADVIVLAECAMDVTTLGVQLSRGCSAAFLPDAGHSDKLRIFRKQFLHSRVVSDGARDAIREISTPIGESVLLVAVHLPSKLRKQTEDQGQGLIALGRHVRDAEKLVGHSRTVVIGDFNSNPFEVGMVGCEGLHAVMDRKVAAGLSRTVNRESYDFFYNPMWSALGDSRGRPAGTFFYNNSSEVNYFWHVFDQALVRPALLKYFKDEGVQVITELGGKSLLNALGRPDVSRHSDHLPIVLRLSTEQKEN